ncbi:alpha/beta hydrolase [Nocardiopsis sediminis]|uniref:Alpha/beta hydrolase n=1 Tax=Nocardiopsis sediminis TaxID=1778267 RepID=A0ABV8FIW0_9ACTN
MNTKRWARGAAPAALAALLAAGCTPAPSGDGTGAGSDPLAEFHAQEISWEQCDAGFECGTYDVPLDYEDPGGARLSIAVKRLPATGDREGSLLINPGGPGGSGYDYAGSATGVVSEQVRERYDVVGFDPRGVGRSSPVTCLDRAQLDDFLGAEYDSEDGDSDSAELTDDGLRQMEQGNRDFVDACWDSSGDLLPHVGTADVARDMDVLRAVLGDDRLTYLGKSYGTYIGTVYADLFPDRVRALVLDGALDPSVNQLELSVQQATGFETALRAFITDCLDRADCPLGGPDDTVGSATGRIEGLLADAAREPLRNDLGDGREVNRARVETGIVAALYSETFWPQVRTALADAFDGDGTALLRLGDRLYDRGSERAYENSTAALVAVNCADHPSPRDIGDYEEAAAEAAEESPIFGPTLAWGALPCAYWPEEAVAEPAPLTGAGADPILVVGTTRDPATPYEWSEALAGRLESGVLLTREGDGHTAYRTGDDCIDAAVDAYLLAGEVPEDGTVCRE